MPRKKAARRPDPLTLARAARQANRVDPNETKRDRFERIAGKRMNRVLADIEAIGNASASGYEYTQEDIDVMRATLHEAIDRTLLRFEARKLRVAGAFSFAGSKPNVSHTDDKGAYTRLK